MNQRQRARALEWARKLMPPDEFERMESIDVHDLGFGFDQFGMEKESTILAYGLARYLHKYYFRVASEGHENIPTEGPGLIVSNHSGALPIDAAMTAVDVAMNMVKPRPLRTIVDNFAGFLPFVNVFFYRVGQVIGHRRNVQDLLHAGELVGVWPEGTRGLGKPFSRRYNLMRFGVGFIELSLTHRAPIVPTVLIGAEEQLPIIGNLKPLARAFGFPYMPVTPFFPWFGPLGLLPLPVKYHIYYGEPIHFYREHDVRTLEDPEAVTALADKVKLVMQDMINRGLEQRASVFGLGEG
jgi:1-acyl-sn-glycerol-3-phosphate acyltransferase